VARKTPAPVVRGRRPRTFVAQSSPSITAPKGKDAPFSVSVTGDTLRLCFRRAQPSTAESPCTSEGNKGRSKVRGQIAEVIPGVLRSLRLHSNL
jgi:hypothetical protein